VAEKWVLSNGKTLVLAFHTPEEWAAVYRAALLHVGCSQEYAEKVEKLILSAEKPR